MKIFDKDIPVFTRVKEAISHYDHLGGHESVVLICPDPMSGRKNRYTVVRIFFESGETRVIGRELPIAHAREIACRSSVAEAL